MSEETKPKNEQQLVVRVLLGVAIGAGVMLYFYGGCLDHQVQRDMQRLEIQTAQDAERQYQIAKEHGSAMDAYVAAMGCSAAYLQAKDEFNYDRWKKIEKKEARRAGMPE